MIRCEKGKVMVGANDAAELKVELIHVLRTVREALAKKEGDEEAKKAIEICVEISMMGEDELKKETEETLKEVFKIMFEAIFGDKEKKDE